MDVKTEILNVLKPMLKDALKNVLFPELERLVNANGNPVETAIMNVIKGPLEQAIETAIDKL